MLRPHPRDLKPSLNGWPANNSIIVSGGTANAQTTLSAAGGDRFGLGFVDAKEAQNADHLEGLGDEWRWLHQLRRAAHLRRRAQRIHDGADS